MLLSPGETRASTYVVSSLTDGPLSGDVNPGDDLCENIIGNCQLRTAIEEANAHLGIDAIEFSVAGTFTPDAGAGALPIVTDQLIILGDSAPGFPGLNVNLEQAPPVVYLSGDGTSPGLVFSGSGAAGSLIFALGVVGFTDGIQILQGADNMNLHGCYVGVLGDGTPAGNTGNGILIQSDNNIIGQFIAAGGPQEYGNVISGNGNHGLSLVNSGENRISANRIGTSPDGLTAVPNGANGIDARTPLREPHGNSNMNVIGEIDDDDAIGNLISGNVGHGIYVNAAMTRAFANRIGIALDGQPLGNGGDGINILGGGSIIGFDVPHGRNEIANNANGIHVQGLSNAILNNLVGFPSPLQGHVGYGIRIENSQDSTVENNEVLRALAGGISLLNSMDASVAGNQIGVVYDNSQALNAGSTNPGASALMLDVAFGAQVVSNVIGFYPTGISATGSDLILGLNQVGIDENANPIGNADIGIALRDISTAFVVQNQVFYNGRGIVLASEAFEATNNLVRLNQIARNQGTGVQVREADDVTGGDHLRNHFDQNSIYANLGLGIDLGNDGVTPNDPMDGDVGDNNLQNYPIISQVIPPATVGGALTVGWQMDSNLVNSSYPITAQFYLADSPDSGQGRVYLGSDTVDNVGVMQMTPLPIPSHPSGGWLVATATDDLGNTSEFSPIVAFGDLLFADSLEGL